MARIARRSFCSSGERRVGGAVGGAAALLVLASCASLTPAQANVAALRGVCGVKVAPADSSCVVRSTDHVPGGYVVTVDRRPPAGQDRVAVRVFQNGSIEVTPLDSAASSPSPSKRAPTP